MLETLQSWIWNIGGFILTIMILLILLALGLLLIVWCAKWIHLYMMGLHTKEGRKNLIYWLENKKRLNEIIEKEKTENDKIK